MDARGLLNAAFGIDQASFVRGQEAGDLFEDSVEELIFGHGFDSPAFAEDHATAFATGQANIGVARFTRAIDHTAHNGHLNGRLDFGEALLNFVCHAHHVDLYAPAGGAGDEGD